MVSQGASVAGLLLNILILPGLGTVIWGNKKHGIWQLILAIVGIITFIVIIGFFFYAAAWIWALVSGIKLVKSASP